MADSAAFKVSDDKVTIYADGKHITIPISAMIHTVQSFAIDYPEHYAVKELLKELKHD